MIRPSSHRTSGQSDWKQAVTNDFLRGESVADISTRCACHRLRVEQVIREAISGLAALKAPKARAVGTEPQKETSDAESVSSELATTENEANIA